MAQTSTVVAASSRDKFQVFDPGLADTMGAAFDNAWQSFEKMGVGLAEADREYARESLAMRIIATAQCGERNPIRLCDDALAHLTQARALRKRA